MVTLDLNDMPSATKRFDLIQAEPVVQKKSRKKKEKSIDKLAETFLEDSNERNFFNLTSRIKWGLRSYIYGIVNDNNAVDDVMSRTLEQIYFKKHLFKNDVAKFSTWVYGIAYYYAIKYLKDIEICRTRINCVDGDISDMYEKYIYEDTESDQDCGEFCGYTDESDIDLLFNGAECIMYSKEKIASDIYDASIDCIQYLPDKCRLVIKERYINQKKVEDIAIQNNFSVYDVKNWLVKARKLLKAEVKKRYSDLYNVYLKSNIS